MDEEKNENNGESIVNIKGNIVRLNGVEKGDYDYPEECYVEDIEIEKNKTDEIISKFKIY